MKKIIFLAVLLFVYSAYGFTSDTVKVMCYNLLGYGFFSDPRDLNYRKIIKAAAPDILTIEEVVSQEGVNEFLDSVMNYYTPGLYNAGTYVNGTDTDNGIFFKPSKFIFISNTPIIVPVTGARDMNVFRLKHITSNREILIISLHLKSGSQNAQMRSEEVLALRQFTDSLPYGTNFIVQGDCNLQGATEQAYLNLTAFHSNSDGHCIDPLNLPGTWNQNPAYAIYHTQSTRTRSFGGGSAGGLDDRFDLMLLSRSVSVNEGIQYVQGSYRVFGNDGNHFNDSINRRPNNAVPDSLADALFFSSDHLPVYSLFIFSPSSGIIKVDENIPDKFKLYQNYPNPFNQTSIIRFQLSINCFVTIKIFDINGCEISTLVNDKLNSGNYQFNFDGNNLGSGIYFYQMRTSDFKDTKRLILLK